MKVLSLWKMRCKPQAKDKIIWSRPKGVTDQKLKLHIERQRNGISSAKCDMQGSTIVSEHIFLGSDHGNQHYRAGMAGQK